MTDDQGGSPAKKATVGSLIGWIVAYTVARIALILVITGIIIAIGLLVGVKVWIVAALAFAVVIAIPLGMVVFKSLRLKVNAQIAEIDADRAARKADLQSRLSGHE